MKNDPVVLELTRAQAVVLSEWLFRTDRDESLSVVDPSEQRVLWLLEGQLESVLVEPLRPDYAELLAKARKEVNEGR